MHTACTLHMHIMHIMRMCMCMCMCTCMCMCMCMYAARCTLHAARTSQVSAINSEHAKNLQQDYWRYEQLLKLRANQVDTVS